SSVARGTGGEVYNVNADTAAAALAVALGAAKLVVLTDVAGLFANWPGDGDSPDQAQDVISQLTATGLERLLPGLSSGMIPKMEACLRAVRGEGCQVWDADGNQYTDLIAGIAVSALGHAHPALTEAVTRQVRAIAHTSNLFLHETEITLAERLLRLLGSDGRVFLANSGTE